MSPERGGGEESQEQPQYYRAARFMREGPARRAYFAAQEAIFQTPCELSTYRIVLNGVWHVAVMGQGPLREVGHRLERAPCSGDPVQLPDDVLEPLLERSKAERS